MTVETSQPRLTPRELEVARLVSKAWSYERIAKTLSITPGTVYDHIANIADKIKMPGNRRVVVAVWYAVEEIKNNDV
jgi:DNA-binding CsgD family transcriptional regulator